MVSDHFNRSVSDLPAGERLFLDKLLVGENCLVRDATFEDVEDMVRWRNEARLAFFDSRPVTLEQTLNFLARSGGYHFIVEHEGKPCGYSSIYDIGRESGLAEVGRIVLDSCYRGNGIMHEARHLMTEYVFAETPIAKLHAVIRRDNPVGIRFHLSVGFELEGWRRQHVLATSETGSTVVDVVFGGMLKERYLEDFDWRKRCYREPNVLSQWLKRELGLEREA